MLSPLMPHLPASDARCSSDAMGMVMQEPILFNYSIYENILYGKPDAKNSEILKAAEIANAMEFIK